MKKQILLALMALTSLGSLQASSYLNTTFTALKNLSTQDKVILTVGSAALAIAAYSFQQETLKKKDKQKLEALRVLVDKEHETLEKENNNEDKKYALIQDISTSQKAHDSFVDEALYFYHRHATEVEKAQLKPLFEKATNNIQNIEALMASVKQTLHPDDIDFETDMKSFHEKIETFKNIHTELSNSLKTLKKDLPEML